MKEKIEEKIVEKSFVSGGEKNNRKVVISMTPHQLQGKIESLGVVTEDRMFIKYSNDGILDLVELIQAERKEAIRGLVEYLEANTEKIFYLGCGKMISEYLGTVESEDK